MIRLENLHKKYNHGKRNEIHVIDNINLEFEETGLVCLLGPSGSGKTTLLNAIGGLDKVDSGTINFDGVEMNRYSFSKWDTLRRKNIGFIFQNYLLLPDLSVYENVRFSLRLSDLPEEKVDERVEYALKAVKMDKFKRRKARNLSGGQQQRVAIARALVTSPNVIIADEPTGNLDAVNSMQIMNIIKKISEECLVILVTHNRNLASFYADRIIELQDGKIIKDYHNTSTGNLQLKQDQNIYLQDLAVDELKNNDVNLKYFYQYNKTPVEINVIYMNNTLYVTADGEGVEVKFLTPTDEVKLIDGKKEDIEHIDIVEFDYNLDKINATLNKTKAAISFKSAFSLAAMRLKSLKGFQKALLSVFALTAILIVISVALFFGIKKVQLDKLINTHKNLVIIEAPLTTPDYIDFLDKLQSAKGKYGIDHFTSTETYNNIFYVYDLYLQIALRNTLIPLEGTMVDINSINSNQLLMGRMPEKQNEIVVDRVVLDRIMTSDRYSELGLTKYEHFLFEEYDRPNGMQGKIVGIVETNNQAIYLNYQEFIILRDRDIIHESEINPQDRTYEEELTRFQVLVNENYHDFGDKEIRLEGLKYEIVGTFKSNLNNKRYALSTEGAERLFIYRQLLQGTLAIFSIDKENTLEYLANNEEIKSYIYSYYDIYQKINNDYYRRNRVALSTQSIFSIITLISSLLFLYFVIRSSLMSRIYEIGVYRALGVPRKDIYKMFFAEIVLINVFTSLIGWALVSYLFLRSRETLVYSRLYYTWPIAIAVLGCLFIVNIIVGLVPVISLLRKTPAEILTKYDI